VTDTTDLFRDWDAAYVLGALDAEDRRSYEQHLSTCPACSAALADFAGIPGILSKLSTADAVELLADEDVTAGLDDHLRAGAHVPGLVQRLAVATKRRRRRIRFAAIGAAAVVVAILATGGVLYSTGHPAGQGTIASAVAMSPVKQDVITASMSVTPKTWGTRFDWSCKYPEATAPYASPVSYDLVVVSNSGAQTVVASWTTTGANASGLSASSAIAFADIRSVEIRVTGSPRILLRQDL
jgi:anti-sigma factor RsiW